MANKNDCPDENAAECIVAKSVHDFVANLSSKQRLEFYRVIKHVRIYVDRVHPTYEFEVEKKAFIGKFHQHFIEKVISNCKDEEWQSKSVTAFATIFPFKVSKDVEELNLDIFNFLSSEFENHIKKFLDDHFDEVNVQDGIRLFLRNIHIFRTTNGQVGPCGDSPKENCAGKLEDLLLDMKISSRRTNGIPKLTEKGVERYLHLYKVTEQAMKSFSPSQAEEISFDKYDQTYFLNLPETNINDLYSLLDPEFFQSNPEEYKKLFEKYIFFFLHALQCEQENPVFFIDDLLYICLKSLRTFEKSRESPVNLKNHLGNITCVYQRKQQSNDDNSYVVSDRSLKEIEKYFQGLQKIDTAILHYSDENAPLEHSRVFAATDYEAFDVCFSRNKKDRSYNFISLIISAAFSPINFEKLCIYNVYLGTKSWLNNPKCKEAVLQFVQKYSRPAARDTTPERFLIKNFEQFYEL